MLNNSWFMTEQHLMNNCIDYENISCILLQLNQINYKIIIALIGYEKSQKETEKISKLKSLLEENVEFITKKLFSRTATCLTANDYYRCQEKKSQNKKKN